MLKAQSTIQMSCTPPSESRCSPSENDIRESNSFDEKKLGSAGRIQFFFHTKDELLPIRDIPGRDKTEPHIEESAENYCNPCYQRNIRGFLNTDNERYLFLFTRCRDRSSEHYDQRRIVGYLEKERKLDMESHLAAQGTIQLVRFTDSVTVSEISDSPRKVRVKCLGEQASEKLVAALNSNENILDDCVDRVDKLKKETTTGTSDDCGGC